MVEMWRRTMVLALVMIVALALVACGDSDSDDAASESSAASTVPEATESPQDEGLIVVATDLRFSAATFRAAPGPVEVTYRNEGQAMHTLVIEGVADFKLDVPKHGDVDKATVDLEPGTYTIFCDIPGHRDAGMQAKLAVA
jgi:plastocyanin